MLPKIDLQNSNKNKALMLSLLPIIVAIIFYCTQVYISNSSSSQNIKWLTHIILIAIIFIIIFYLPGRRDSRKLKLFSYILNSLIYLISLIFVTMLKDSLYNKIVVISLLVSYIILIFSKILLKEIQEKNLILFILIIITSFSFMNLPNGSIFLENIKISTNRIVFLGFLVLCLILFICYKDKINFKVLNMLIVLINLLFSFRRDQIDIRDGSYFHISYFSEVVRSLKSGGTLLWDTPSQYGFLSVLIPTLLPLNDSRYSFFLWQSILMLIYNLFIYIFLKKIILDDKKFFLFYFFYFLFFNFADPALIGPQPFPSSSVIRFGPAVILTLVLINLIKKFKNFEKKQYIMYFLFSILTFLWSAESFVYGTFISGIFLILILLNTKINIQQKIFVIIISLSNFISFYFLTNLYTFIKVGKKADFEMFYMYSKSYSEGYGSVPLSFLSPSILIYTIIFCIVLFIKISKRESKIMNNYSNGDLIAILIIFIVLIFFTYYLGRAVSNNIMVLIPIYYLFFSIVYFETKIKVLKNYLLIVFFTFSILFVVSTLMQPKLLTKLSNISIGINKIPPKTTLKFDQYLFEDFKKYNSDDIVLSSWAAGVPRELTLNQNFDQKSTPLPVPLLLLEEPISKEKAIVIIERFISSNNIKNIILYQLKDNEFERRYSYWIDILNRFYQCKQTSIGDKFFRLECVN